MARAFVTASTQYLSRASAVVSGVPLSMAGWFRLRAGGSGALCYLDNDSTGSNRLGLLANGVGATLDAQIQSAVTSGHVGSAGNIAASETWYHAAGVYASASSRSVYLDGGSKATSVVAVTPTLTDTHLGVLDLGGSLAAPLGGDLGEWAIWNVALTDADVVALATGVSPLFVQPSALVAYWPLMGVASPEIDLVAHRDLTVTGATAAVHPRVYLPISPQLLVPRTLTLFHIAGVTKGSTGAALGSCTVKLYRASDDALLQTTTSDGSGNYSFTVGNTTTLYYIVAYKDGSPDVAGTSVNTLVGV